MTRRGLSGEAENADLEARLLKIEAGAANSGNSNPAVSDVSNSPSTLPNVGAPAMVGGISIKSRIPGALSIQWTPLDPSTIDRYDIWVSTKLGFEPNANTFKYTVSDRSNSFTFTEGNPQTTYYIVVRGVAGSGRTGPWSAYVNSKTGVATEVTVDRGAFTTVDTQEETFPESALLAKYSATFGALPVSVESPGTLIVLASLYFSAEDEVPDPDQSVATPDSLSGFTISIAMATAKGAPAIVRSSSRNLTWLGHQFFYRETVQMHELIYIPAPGIYTFGIVLSEQRRAYHYKLSVIQLVKAGANAKK
jgi:hypothetical protein